MSNDTETGGQPPAAATAEEVAALKNKVATAEAGRAEAEQDLQLARHEISEAELLAATALRRSRPRTASPSSAQLEPVTVPRPVLAETVVQERVAVRTSGYDASPAFDATAPLFPAKARVMPGGRMVPAKPAEELAGERAEVPILSRVLHDDVLYEGDTTAEVTRAQFEALRSVGATEGVWPI